MLLEDDLRFKASAPEQVRGGAAQTFGVTGIRRYWYWIVVRYPIGIRYTGPFFVSNAPQVLSSSDYVLVVWDPARGADSYDVLRTETPQFPQTAGLWALAIGLTDTNWQDQGAPLLFYDVEGLPWGAPVNRGMTLNNRDYNQPTLQIDAPVQIPQIIFRDGSVQDTAGVDRAPNDGQAYGRKDDQWTPVVQLDGDTMTGPLILATANPVAPLEAVPKEYVDGKLATDEAPFDDNAYGRYHYGWIPTVMTLGGTMTGPLLLSSNPNTSSPSVQAATKAYVDRIAPVPAPMDGNTYGLRNWAWTQVVTAAEFQQQQQQYGQTPNQIPGLILWLAAEDRAGAAVLLSGLPSDQGLPVPLDTTPLPDRTGVAAQNATGSAIVAPAWGGLAATTYLTTSTSPARGFLSQIGPNRLDNGWTYLMLWYPYQQPLSINTSMAMMTYRQGTSAPLGGPAITLTNPASGAGTGFCGLVYDGSLTQPTQVFAINWNTGWYMVGFDGSVASRLFKLRVNGLNGAQGSLTNIDAQGSSQMIWGNGAWGLMLEGCVFDRPLSDAEYLAIENYWMRKYDNIQLGTFTINPPPTASELALSPAPVPAGPPPSPTLFQRVGNLWPVFVNRTLQWTRNTFSIW